MDSLTTLNDLRAAKVKRQQERVQCAEVKKQLELIQTLQRKKALLITRLETLCDGASADILDIQVPSLRHGRNALCTLKEKLSACRLLGPCGLTVADVEPNCLVVTFTSMWKSTTESYILKIEAVDGQIKVSGTNIPYFIDVQSMLDKSRNLAWHRQMDDISHKLNAYTQRKGELVYVMEEYKKCVKRVCHDESVTSIELIMSHKDRQTGLDKDMCIYLSYPEVDSLLPLQVIITTENMIITSQILSALREKFSLHPLSSVMPDVLKALVSCPVLDFLEASDD